MDVAGVGPIQSIEISEDGMVRQAVHDTQAIATAFEIGGSHVGGIFADNVHECRFELGHLARDTIVGESVQRRMGPPECKLVKRYQSE